MDTPPPIPTVAGPPTRAIRYQLSRMDIFANWITSIFRIRLLQGLIVAVLIFEGWLVASHSEARTTREILSGTLIYLVEFFAVLFLLHCILGLAWAFLLKQRGIVGDHVLEITEEGLVERTAVNQALHKWPGVVRISSFGGYLYIYVTDSNYHLIPKRRLPAQEIREFEADVRAHCEQTKR